MRQTKTRAPSGKRPSLKPVLFCSPLLLATLAACGQGAQTVSTTKHDEGKPVRNTDAWNWHAATRDDYQNIMAPLLGLDASTMIAADDPAVVKTQQWLDRIDASVRSLHPDQVAGVPKPQAMVLKDSDPNAFVAPVTVCYKVPVKLAASGSSLSKVYLDVRSGQFDSMPDDMNCLDGGDAQAASVQAMVSRFNSSSTDCQLAFDGTTLTPNSQCQQTDAIAGAGTADSLVILETANFVTIHSGIIPIMSEPEFASVLAHELGHYYRSHITAPKNDYDFFYTMSQASETHKPVAEPDKAAFGAKAYASATLLDTAANFPAVDGQKIRSELFFTVGTLIKQVCDSGSCSSDCKTASKLLNGSAFADKIGKFPLDKRSDAEVAAYNQYETAALACLVTVKASTDSGVLTASKVSFDALVKLAAAPSWPGWTTQISQSTQQALASLNQSISDRLGQSTATGATAADLVLNASAAFNTQDQDAQTTLKQAYSQHLGQYTIEQEADDESGEFIAGMGFNPEIEVQAMDALGTSVGDLKDSWGGMMTGQTDCDTMWHANWLGTDGAYDFVPVGDYAEIHHSICFRMFNIERDVKAHNETASTTATLPVMDSSAWASVQSHATDLGVAANGGGGESVMPNVSSLVKDNGIMDCVWAFKYH